MARRRCSWSSIARRFDPALRSPDCHASPLLWVLWDGGGSVCDETVFATRAAAVLAEARERAHRLVAAYPTQPDLEADVSELVDASADP
jgi:hypothetical protein